MLHTLIAIISVVPLSTDQTDERYPVWARASCETPELVMTWYQADKENYMANPSDFPDGCTHRIFLDTPDKVVPFLGIFISKGDRIELEELLFSDGTVQYRIAEVFESQET